MRKYSGRVRKGDGGKKRGVATFQGYRGSPVVGDQTRSEAGPSGQVLF